MEMLFFKLRYLWVASVKLTGMKQSHKVSETALQDGNNVY